MDESLDADCSLVEAEEKLLDSDVAVERLEPESLLRLVLDEDDVSCCAVLLDEFDDAELADIVTLELELELLESEDAELAEDAEKSSDDAEAPPDVVLEDELRELDELLPEDWLDRLELDWLLGELDEEFDDWERLELDELEREVELDDDVSETAVLLLELEERLVLDDDESPSELAELWLLSPGGSNSSQLKDAVYPDPLPPVNARGWLGIA